MTQIGWMQDSHNSKDRTVGALSRLSTDMQTLVDTVGVGDIVWTGDQVHPAGGKGDKPHFPADGYQTAFWDDVEASGYYDRVLAALPGNHDVPVQGFIESDPVACDRFEKHYGDGVSVFGVNSAKPGYLTGSPGQPSGAGVAGGQGPNTARIAYGDLRWLDERLGAAPSNNTKIVFSHHSPHLLGDAALANSNLGIDHTPYSPTRNFRDENRYDVVQNWFEVHQTLNQYSRVVVPISHIFQFVTEGSEQIGNVSYAWKKHYYRHSNDSVQTYAYVIADSTGVTINTREHSDGTETTILNKTW